MLASPLLPAPTFSTQHSAEDSTQYRPSRDLEAFNNLLPPPIEFIEGSSSGSLAVAEGKYEPINGVPTTSKQEVRASSRCLLLYLNVYSQYADPPLPAAVTPTKAPSSPKSSSNIKNISLHPTGIDITWPQKFNRGSGLLNTGNTCFLNSSLQCLLHTPPLLQILLSHNKDTCQCRVEKAFCMSCNLRVVAVQAHSSKNAFSPTPITNRLQTIAKHMRRGRQEDSHEFLRYAIDALQRSCLAGYPTKIDPKLAETTWVHKIFGGRLRSRVTCGACGYNSDTFDRTLDLSLDIQRSDSLTSALHKFVAIDYLKGADKYKCEKCKKPVTAEKRFSIQEAPMVLTIHLKRFSPLGRKIPHLVQYDENLHLKPYMSEGQFGPSYSLYGVICHAGGGPNSGHYYAFIKSNDGRWWEMNDESVTPLSSPPTNKKSAYILFYIRTKGQSLETAMKSTLLPPISPKVGLAAGMKKKKERHGGEVEEDRGEVVTRPFIGPLLPSPTIADKTLDLKPPRATNDDPQATKIKAKIENAKYALESLTTYVSDDADDDDGEGVDKQWQKSRKDDTAGSSSSPAVVSLPSSPISLSKPSSTGIPPATFYSGSSSKKRKTPDNDNNDRPKTKSKGMHQRSEQSLLRESMDPFRRLTKKHNRPPTGI
ncbi:hypothetical protein BDQ17DRAFT_1303029 [Cyathus striatus]|nr:hypothetical protein BDQ17DRAFT_1303029 [Cyathus striatus]